MLQKSVKNYLATLVLLGVLLSMACGGTKYIVGTDSSRQYLPLESAEIVATLELAMTDSLARTGPCAEAPCLGTVRIVQVLNAGQAFAPALGNGDLLTAHFVYTLDGTEKLFPNSAVQLPGLNRGDKFQAQVRIVGEQADGQKIYEIAAYRKL